MQGKCQFIYEFTESAGQGLTWGAFFLLGLVLMPEAIHHLDLAVLGIIFSSLFIVRPLAIWLSLVGTDADQKPDCSLVGLGPAALQQLYLHWLWLKKSTRKLASIFCTLRSMRPGSAHCYMALPQWLVRNGTVCK